ncbi:MAG: DUF3280 domain-containing protein [Gammaproteobacteria bacterium]
MKSHPLTVRRCALFSLLVALCALVPASAAETHRPVKLLVLDLELVGDVGDPALEQVHERRTREMSELLRRELARVPRYEIVDSTPAQERIETLRAVQYLHKCNGCELDIALELEAEQVLVAWVYRVSQLILSLTYEIREVPSGQPLRRRSFDFRGDNDEAWARAVKRMVKELE